MGWFQKSKSYLGVDLAVDAVKIVELKSLKGRPQLVTYGFSEQALDVSRQGFLNDIPQMSALLRKVCNEAKITTREAVAALPVAEVFGSVINLSKISLREMNAPDQLSALVQWEAKKLIPLPLEEMVLDWKVINENKKKEEANKNGGQVETLSVLLTAAPKDLVSKYVEIFKIAGLELLSLETDAFAHVRVFAGNDPSIMTIIDIGALTTNISLVQEGIPYLNKSVDIGGISITRSIAEKLGISLEDAEQYKLDLGKTDAKALGNLIEPTLDALVNEIRYCFDIYKKGSGNDSSKIEKIILTGGTALLPNVVNSLASKLEKRVFIGDPWARIIYPYDLKPILDKIGPKMSIALGLAMRNI